MDDIDLGLSDASNDEDVETMTAAEVLQKLEEAWLNEKFSPDLLESKSEIVECMLGQLAQMEENIERARKGDFKVSVHRMEIDRIRYLVSSYLRMRLKKIEKYTTYMLDQEEKSKDEPKMSPEELAYAKDYHESLQSHFQVLALRHMPTNQQTLDSNQTAVIPNEDSYVFLRVNEDTEGVLVEEETEEAREEILDLEQGDQHIMRYRPVAALVQSGAVSLI